MDQQLQQEADKFSNELLWCIRQLETGLQKQSPTSKQGQEAWRLLKILRSQKAPIIKKKQVMRNAFGDYRKKMKDGEKKSMNSMKHSRFQNSALSKAHSKSRFLRQSHTKQGCNPHGGAEWTSINSNLRSLTLTAASCSQEDGASCTIVDDRETQQGNGKVFNGSPADKASLCLLDKKTTSLLEPVNSSAQLNAEGKRLFKFISSDNSFVFGFQNDESNNQEVLADDQGADTSSRLAANDGSNLVQCSTDAMKVSDVNELRKNYYTYEKSSNDFCFDFNDAD